MLSATLAFVDERLFLTVIQSMLPLHECAAESVADPAATGAALTETYCLCVQV
jgi:hypothetical protein